MRIGKLVAGADRAILAVLALLVCAAIPAAAGSRPLQRFHLEKNDQGLVLPFRIVNLPLSDFAREYARLTSTPIATGGALQEDVKGSVTLFLRRPLKVGDLTGLFHRVLDDNGFSVVDSPAGNGWVIVKQRDARDMALPVHSASDAPDSGRLITAYYDLKHADAESVARMMRSFMPAFSRIIPTNQGQVFITDTASNIRKLTAVIARMDTPDAARRQQEVLASLYESPLRSCGEHRIEKLVVEHLDIQNGAGK